jgi:SAM-dependent methyltransferase
VWEPAAERLLSRLGEGAGKRALDAGCGVYGWLPALSRWVGPQGRVVGTDIAESMLSAARTLGLKNVDLVQDDLFKSQLAPASFDLVHARFQLAPLGRFAEQIAALRGRVRPGGLLVLEDPDPRTWAFTPAAPATEQLLALIARAFAAAGGDFEAGLKERALLEQQGLKPDVRTEMLTLAEGHPYLRLPLQFAASLRPRLLALAAEAELDALLARVESELATCSGTTFTLVQTWATVP